MITKAPHLPLSPTAGSIASAEEVPPQQVLADLFQEHGEQVGRWAMRLGGPGFDAEETVQEVFARVGEHLHGFRKGSRTSTWLYAITENVVREQRRRIRRWRFFSLGSSEASAVPATRPLPIEDVERREATALVYRALDRMSDPYRTALILFELEGLSGESIAELKGVKVATVWVWLHRGREKFAKHLEDLGGRS